MYNIKEKVIYSAYNTQLFKENWLTEKKEVHLYWTIFSITALVCREGLETIFNNSFMYTKLRSIILTGRFS